MVIFEIIQDIPTTVFGNVLQKQVEDRLKFYDAGVLPPKNAEVMADAVLKAEEAKNEIIKKDKKKKKKEKKKKETEAEETAENGDESLNASNGHKNGNVEEHLEEMKIDDEEPVPKKKKKKSKNNE